MKKKEWIVPQLRMLKATEAASLDCSNGSSPDIFCSAGGGGGA